MMAYMQHIAPLPGDRLAQGAATDNQKHFCPQPIELVCTGNLRTVAWIYVRRGVPASYIRFYGSADIG
jgi:hypothetical protein